MEEDTQEAEKEAGSFSPELLHGDDDEEAIDPDEDRALLVTCLIQCLLSIWEAYELKSSLNV